MNISGFWGRDIRRNFTNRLAEFDEELDEKQLDYDNDVFIYYMSIWSDQIDILIK